MKHLEHIISFKSIQFSIVLICISLCFFNAEAQSKKKQIATLNYKLDSTVASSDSLLLLLEDERLKSNTLSIKLNNSIEETESKKSEIKSLNNLLSSLQDSLDKEINFSAYINRKYSQLSIELEELQNSQDQSQKEIVNLNLRLWSLKDSLIKAEERIKSNQRVIKGLEQSVRQKENLIIDKKQSDELIEITNEAVEAEEAVEVKDIEEVTTETLEEDKTEEATSERDGVPEEETEGIKEMGPISFQDAKGFILNKCRTLDQVIENRRTAVINGRILYMFFAKAQDGTACIYSVSEYKLEVFTSDCGSYANKLQEWERFD